MNNMWQAISPFFCVILILTKRKEKEKEVKELFDK